MPESKSGIEGPTDAPKNVPSTLPLKHYPGSGDLGKGKGKGNSVEGPAKDAYKSHGR